MKAGWMIKIASASLGTLLLAGYFMLAARSEPARDYTAWMGTSSPVPSPAVGEVIKLPRKGTFGREMPVRGELLLVVAGNCYACSTTQWSPRAVLTASKRRVVVLYWVDPDAIGSDAVFLGTHASIICDPKQKLLPSNFDYFSPRAFVVDASSGRVLHIQDTDESMDAFVERV